MSKSKDIDLSPYMPNPGSSAVVLDKYLLALLKQLVAMGLVASWEVRINGPIGHEFRATKLLQRLGKKIKIGEP